MSGLHNVLCCNRNCGLLSLILEGNHVSVQVIERRIGSALDPKLIFCLLHLRYIPSVWRCINSSTFPWRFIITQRHLSISFRRYIQKRCDYKNWRRKKARCTIDDEKRRTTWINDQKRRADTIGGEEWHAVWFFSLKIFLKSRFLVLKFSQSLLLSSKSNFDLCFCERGFRKYLIIIMIIINISATNL